MHSGKLIFAQLMEHLLEKVLMRCVARYRGNHKIHSFSCQDQFLCMAFAQLTFRDSLRDIDACLRSQTEKLYHMGIRAQVSRNTLANANATRDWRIYADFAPRLIGIARKLLRWHRELVALKWTFLERLIVQMAKENPSWGYTRIRGALMNLDIQVGRGTIRRILKDHLIEPAPVRGRRISWSMFLKLHWRGLAASDFFSVEVWSWSGLATYYVLFVLELSTRRVSICGMTTHPNDAWMLQVARTLFDSESGALRDMKHLIVDRDTKYSRSFRQAIAREGVEVEVSRLPPRSPNLNAYAERFVRSIKSECVSKLIPIGPIMLAVPSRSTCNTITVRGITRAYAIG